MYTCCSREGAIINSCFFPFLLLKKELQSRPTNTRLNFSTQQSFSNHAALLNLSIEVTIINASLSIYQHTCLHVLLHLDYREFNFPFRRRNEKGGGGERAQMLLNEIFLISLSYVRTAAARLETFQGVAQRNHHRHHHPFFPLLLLLSAH